MGGARAFYGGADCRGMMIYRAIIASWHAMSARDYSHASMMRHYYYIELYYARADA